MQSEHSMVVNKVAQQVLQARESVIYVQQRLNRNLNSDDYRQASSLLVQRRRELAYWLDIYDWTVRNRVPSPEANRDAGADGMTGYEESGDDPLMRLSADLRAAHAADRAKGPDLPRRTPGASGHTASEPFLAAADHAQRWHSIPDAWKAPADNEQDKPHPQD